MNYKDNFVKLSKQEAIENTKKFLCELITLQEKYSLSVNSDDNIYLSFKTTDEEGDTCWDHVKIGWTGDGTGLSLMEKTKSDK